MDVKACDNCKKLNTQTDKPFAFVTGYHRTNLNTGEYDPETVSSIGILPILNKHITNPNASTQGGKMLCSDCTMPYTTELVKQMFSTENVSKL